MTQCSSEVLTPAEEHVLMSSGLKGRGLICHILLLQDRTKRDESSQKLFVSRGGNITEMKGSFLWKHEEKLCVAVSFALSFPLTQHS